MNPKAYGEAFHITAGSETTWGNIVETIGKKLNHRVNLVDIPIEFLQGKKNIGIDIAELSGDKSRDMVFDNSKIRDAVPEFKGEISFDNGIDATILVLQISFHSVPEIVYGIMTILITAYMMNYLLSSGKGCVQVLVMSKEIERMKTMILNDMDAGVTLLDGKSGFYGNETEVVLTILPYRKLPDLKDKIKEIDEKAFIIVSHVEEVSGNGFTYSKEMREASF